MEAANLLKKYLAEQRVMQLATVRAGKPWICTVYFVADAQANLYWLSLPARRHSEELALDNHVAVAMAIKTDQPVIGVQAEGTVTVVADAALVKSVMKDYVAKYDQGQDFYDNFIACSNQHRLYRFTTEQYYLFDEVHFGDGVRHTVTL